MPVNANDFVVMAPFLALAAGALVVLLLDLLLPAQVARPFWYLAALGAIGLAVWYGVRLWPATGRAQTAFGGALVADPLTLVLGGVAVIAAFVAILLSLGRTEDDVSGYLSLVLWAAMGMGILAGATNLMVVFLGLELLSLALYVTVAFTPGDVFAREAALKYFILGSAAAGFLLFGFAFLYGAAGTTELAGLGAFARSGPLPAYFKAGLGLTLAGFAFKLALVPFHLWAPDVYQGAPTPVTAFMSVGTKTAAFAALARFLWQVIPQGQATGLLLPLVALAVLSMFIGSLAALRQDNLKRILAYSGIAHAGYLIMALVGLRQAGIGAGVFYLVAYLFMNLGAFAVIQYLETVGEDGTRVAGYRGLLYRRPALAAGMAVFLFALAGLPPTGGFTGKFLLAVNAIGAGAWVLLLALIITTGISAYVYLRIVGLMIQKDAAGGAGAAGIAGTTSWLSRPVLAGTMAVVVAIAVVGTLQMGVWPQPVVALTRVLFEN